MKTLNTLKLEKVVTNKRGRPQWALVWPTDESFTVDDVAHTLQGKISRTTIVAKLNDSVKNGKVAKTVEDGADVYRVVA
jgi:hypothetical protein